MYISEVEGIEEQGNHFETGIHPILDEVKDQITDVRQLFENLEQD